MPKNIVVYSDGTGQDGGARPEQTISNIYKMYRVSRVSSANCHRPRETGHDVRPRALDGHRHNCGNIPC